MNFSTYTSTLFCILLGVQDVSHSQYYPPQSDSESTISDTPSRTRQYRYFNDRKFYPEYRQHQHHHSPFNDPPISVHQTVGYFGTTVGELSHENESVEKIHEHAITSRVSGSYRKDPPSSENPIFNVPVGISIPRGGMDIFMANLPKPGFDPTQFFRSTNRRPMQQLPDERNEGNDESSIERPPNNMAMLHQTQICPSNSRLYRENGKCYQVGVIHLDICGVFDTTLMVFSTVGRDSPYGDCDCAINNGLVSRPLAYWRPHDRCYFQFHRGPCGYNEWLILDKQNRPVCASRSCPHNSEDSNESQNFWFRHNGKCYKTGRHYAALCPPGEDELKVYLLYQSSGDYQPTCLNGPPVQGLGGKTLLTTVNDLVCRPGHKKLLNGECKRIAHFDDDY